MIPFGELRGIFRLRSCPHRERRDKSIDILEAANQELRNGGESKVSQGGRTQIEVQGI